MQMNLYANLSTSHWYVSAPGRPCYLQRVPREVRPASTSPCCSDLAEECRI